jgi:GMP synthase-like glutamine amidotransferase
MKLTLIQTGEVPAPLRPRFGPYSAMFQRMFASAGEDFDLETVPVFEGAALPDPARLEGVLITGSAAGVHDDLDWLPPLREFIRAAYRARTPMVGICFGHQVMADALGGEVRRAEGGWGLGRHSYAVRMRPDFFSTEGETLSIACSHQDQVTAPPPDAEVFLASEFTPNAGLVYGNGAAVSLQPHPEFDDDYALALAELRRGKVPDAVVDAAVASLARPSDSIATAGDLAAFLRRRA